MATPTGTIDLAFELHLREAEILAGNYASLRANVGTILSAGVAIDAIVATVVVQHRKIDDHLVHLSGAIGSTLLFLSYGAFVLWLRKEILPWPDGRALLTSAVGSSQDIRRQLTVALADAVDNGERRLGRLQLHVAGLVGALGISIGVWLWLLKTMS